MPTPTDKQRIRRRILEELPEQTKRSPANPFVNYRLLPVASDWSAELMLVQLEILEDEGRVELRKLAEECAVKLTPLGWKSLEMSEDEWQGRPSHSIVNRTQRGIINPEVGSVTPMAHQNLITRKPSSAMPHRITRLPRSSQPI